ncbi:Tim44 domain-containing protein [Bacteriovoracales bacterium]|nr:Tim44 domain-containing protein [Bacteriovoracales bacterium]
MKIMAIFLLLFMTFSEVSEARSRRGKFFGKRSGRSFFNSNKRTNTNTFRRNQMGQPRRSGGFMKSMMGAVAGTMIGGFLFKALGMNPGGMGAGGGGGMGFILLLLLIGGGVFLYFRYKKKTAFAGTNYQHSEQGFSEQNTSPFESEPSNYGEENNLDIEQGPQFISDRNKDFFSIQHAWSKKNLDGVKDKMTTEVYSEFMNEIGEMNSKGHTSTLENLMVNKTEVTSSWEENSTKYITLKFDVSLIEYEADKNGNIISGNKDGYTDITELWTFAQEGLGKDWKVSGVETPA